MTGIEQIDKLDDQNAIELGSNDAPAMLRLTLFPAHSHLPL
jgi:hypothetical protein